MGLTACIKEENGAVVGDAVQADFLFDVLDKAKDEHTCCLRYVDPYRHTIFNNGQMVDIAQEVSRLRNHAATDAERDVLNKLHALVARGLEGVHRYLWFVGD
jgi:hypothetical protein